MEIDYTTVTETPGIKASQEQLTRLYHRYRFASKFCEGKDVLEVACGTGIGLGYLAKVAKRVVGGDIDEKNLQHAREHYKSRNIIELRAFDAHKMPFEDNSIDVVLLYEAIYYLAQPEKFIEEARRILRKNGVLIICTVNKDWPDFNPSPFTFKYYSIPELFSLMSSRFSNIAFYGAFPGSTGSLKEKVVSVVKRAAVALHLIPKTMKGKEILKRVFFGKLQDLPSEIEDGKEDYTEPISIPHALPDYNYKVIYAIAHAQ